MAASPTADRARPADVLGSGLAAAGAGAYGITIVLSDSLANVHLGPGTALGIRFGFSALMLSTLLAASGRSLWPAPGERLSVFLLGALGYGTESTLFFMALERGTAAAVALIFYSYHAIVTVLEIPLTRQLPSRRTWIALALSVVG